MAYMQEPIATPKLGFKLDGPFGTPTRIRFSGARKVMAIPSCSRWRCTKVAMLSARSHPGRRPG